MSETQALALLGLTSSHCRACRADSLINYLRLYFCHAQPAGAIAAGLLLILCVFLLLLLFRVLGSTAENFFSPILTQLSQELGLPPRLAGGMLVLGLILCCNCTPDCDCNHLTIIAVTFLALGNGAPDISSSIAAVRAGQYKLALGSLLGKGQALTGTCMESWLLHSGVQCMKLHFTAWSCARYVSSALGGLHYIFVVPRHQVQNHTTQLLHGHIAHKD